MSVKVFFCYAHEDEILLNKLKIHLKPLQRQKLIDIWYDRDISAGTEWKQEIYKHLDEAEIILLLISPDFMNHDYCYSIEMQQAVERHNRGESRVVPIILRPTLWQETPIGKLQPLPRDAKPVKNWPNVDNALFDVAEGIREIVIELTASPLSSGVDKARGKASHTISPVAIPIPNSLEQTRPIFIDPPILHLPPSSTASPSFQGIAGTPPPTNVRTIQQREKIVEYIYYLVADSDTTFIALTGIGGVGKSTLAALVYEYAEKQRHSGTGLLTGEATWLEIQPNSTLVDIAGNLFQALGKPMPDFNHLSPYNQATELYRALNTADNPRLIILDQFERLLDWQTGMALPDRPGIGEWLDALNSQPCRCRILLTSRPTPQGAQNYPPTYMHEYVVEGMGIAEGAELLHKQGIQDGQATYAELTSAAVRCEGHALSLVLLASILRSNRSLRLTTLLDNLLYTQKWKEDIAQRLLDYIYKQQLDEVQRKWLVSFAIYRHPIPIDAAQQVMQSDDKNILDTNDQSNAISALDALLAQHLLQNGGSGSELYQLHTIVSEYAKDHIDVESRQTNRKMLKTFHSKAAKYYVSCTETSALLPSERNSIDDVKFIIETIWHYCQAGRWREAYTLMLQANLFDDLRNWGNNVELLELCHLFLPSPEWQPELTEKVFIYKTIAQICDSLETRDQSLEYNKRALKIQREINDYEGEAKTLHNIGMLYLKRGQLPYGFACIRLALYIFETMKSTSECENEKRMLQEIQEAIGDKDYAMLLTTVEPQTYQIVEKALRVGL